MLTKFLKSTVGLLSFIVSAGVGRVATKSETIGAGKARALAREEVQRVRQAKRLKNAAEPQITRQQHRATDRIVNKIHRFTPTQQAIVAIGGELPRNPKGAYTNKHGATGYHKTR